MLVSRHFSLIVVEHGGWNDPNAENHASSQLLASVSISVLLRHLEL